MPDPICRPPVQDTTALLHEATGLGEEARLEPPPPPADHRAQQAGEIALHIGLDTAAEGSTVVAAGAAAVLLPITTLVGGTMMIVEAYEEGERRDLQHQSEILRGALSALEGNSDSPAARIAARNSPGFAEGVRRVTAHWGERVEGGRMAQIARLIQSNVREGRDAVLRGEDRGECFDERCRMDPAYRHGVEHARRLREEQPEEFATQQRRQAELHRDVAHARIGTVRP